MSKVASLSKSEKERAQALHERALVIDAMNPSAKDEAYLQKIRGAGVDVVGHTLGPFYYNFRQVVEGIADWYVRAEQFSNQMRLILRPEDIHRAQKEGKVGVMFKTNNIHIEEDLRLLRIMKQLGMKSLQLAYNEKNFVGDGCGERTDCGLSYFGIKIVEEMNKLNLLVDLSHVGYATSRDAIEVSKDPVVFTHSNARGLCENARNIPDDLIRACAEKGGVIGINGFPYFLRKDGNPTLSDFIGHIEYVEKLVGVDHVGIGTDMIEGIPMTDARWARLLARPEIYGKLPWNYWPSSVTQFPEITGGLVARGYSDQEVEKILGLNFLRVFQKVWRE